jgi:hypothetical protein
VTSLNLTVLKAGVSTDGGNTFAFNVIPHEAEAGFDMRVPPSVPFAEIRALLDRWCVRVFFWVSVCCWTGGACVCFLGVDTLEIGGWLAGVGCVKCVRKRDRGVVGSVVRAVGFWCG